MKIAIVGAGFCGLATTWFLLNSCSSLSKLKVHLFDSKDIGQGTSGIATGLLHPFSGAHAKLNWNGREGFHATGELIEISSQALGRSVIARSNGILRLAISEEQQKDFQICAKLNHDIQWLEAEECQLLAPGCAFKPGILIKDGLTIYSEHYLHGLWKACSQKGALFEKKKIHSLKDLANFDVTIVTAGAESLHFAEFSSLSINNVKGQILELLWPQHLKPLSCTLNSHVYLLMSEKGNTCLAGATYEKKFSDALVDLDAAKKEILPKLFELFPPLKNANVIGGSAGMRAVTRQHRPLIQRLSATQWLLTGMGSKGLLYHALFAKELVQNIMAEIL